jgi:hypothetical protein
VSDTPQRDTPGTAEVAATPAGGRRRAVVIAVVVVIGLAAAVVGFAMGGSSDKAKTAAPAGAASGGSTATTAAPTTASTLPGIGTVQTAQGGGQGGCRATSTCTALKVRCPGVSVDATATVDIAPSPSAPNGVLVLLSGGGGTTWWGDGTTAGPAMLDTFAAQGLRTVLVRWQPGWLQAPKGELDGPAALACRPATIIDWVHTNVPPPPPSPGHPCGFCVTGNSGGASQVAYALGKYGLGQEIDLAVMTSGPPHASLAEGCTDTSGPLAFGPDANFIDASYGGGSHPCANHDASFVPRWQQDSADAGTAPKLSTHVVMMSGGGDGSSAVPHAKRFVSWLQSAGNDVQVIDIPGMSHDIAESDAGLQQLKALLLP